MLENLVQPVSAFLKIAVYGNEQFLDKEVLKLGGQGWQRAVFWTRRSLSWEARDGNEQLTSRFESWTI